MSEALLTGYFEAIIDPKDLLYPWRKRSWDSFQALGLPTKKSEAFQYVPLKGLDFPPLAFVKEGEGKKVKKGSLSFLDGFFLGADLPPSLICLPLQEAMRTYGVFLQNRLTKTLKEEKDPFALLNGAVQGKGVFLYVPPKVEVKEPLYLEQILESADLASPRIQIYLGKGSKLTLIQKYEGSGFCNVVVDAALDQNAELFFFEGPSHPKTRLFSAFRASVKKDARVRYFSHAKGAELSRYSLKAELLEENGEVLFQGLSELKGALQNHIHASVHHLSPNTTSRQHFKSVLKESSSFSFEGKIFVDPLAQKTRAYQLNNNLLLSKEAKAHAKPNLEIFADDVKASHGATFGSLDQEALFYLRSRGLEEKEAKQWLIEGFCRDLLDTLPPSFLGER